MFALIIRCALCFLCISCIFQTCVFRLLLSICCWVSQVVLVNQLCICTCFNCVSDGVSCRCVWSEADMCTGLNLLFSRLYTLRFVCRYGGVKVKCFVFRWMGLMAFCPMERMQWWRPANFWPSWTLRRMRKILTTLKICRCTPAGMDDTPALISHAVIMCL